MARLARSSSIRRSASTVTVALVAAAALIGATVSDTPALAQSPPPVAPKPIITEAAVINDGQDKYGILSGDIQNAAKKLDPNGFVASKVVPTADRLVLYWHGDLPEAIKAVISKSGLRVDITFVPYSQASLNAEARKLVDDNPGAVTRSAFGKDYKSLRLWIRSGTAPEIKGRLAQPISMSVTPSIKAQFPNADAMPVLIVSDEDEPSVPLERQTDSEPFWGGSTIVGDEPCSTAFVATDNDGGRVGLVTAQHCNGLNWFNSDGNLARGTEAVGFRLKQDINSDSMLIWSSDSSFQPRVYNGGPRSSSSLPVGYWSDPPEDWKMSENGSLTGEVSGVSVWELGVQESVRGVTRGPGFVTNWSGDEFGSAGEGDSGAVAHRALHGSDGVLYMQITGIISSGLSFFARKCRAYDVGGRQCFRQIFHVYINTVLNGLDVTPVHG